ncbi:MAG: 2-oxoacid:acceptor oxidoreductase family protein, partial [Candidatus Bathyarchaeia archaeon]
RQCLSRAQNQSTAKQVCLSIKNLNEAFKDYANNSRGLLKTVLFQQANFFSKVCITARLNVFGTNDYQSLIRGGHNFYVVQVKDEKVYSQTDNIDLLLALNAEIATLHIGELVTNGGIIYDPDDIPPEIDFRKREDLKFYPVPLKKRLGRT